MSSLQKYFEEHRKACTGRILVPPRYEPQQTYWLNRVRPDSADPPAPPQCLASATSFTSAIKRSFENVSSHCKAHIIAIKVDKAIISEGLRVDAARQLRGRFSRDMVIAGAAIADPEDSRASATLWHG